MGKQTHNAAAESGTVPTINKTKPWEFPNQVSWVVAIIAAAASISMSWHLIIHSNSKYAIQGPTTHLKTWEDNRWMGVRNTNLFKRAAYLLRRCTAPTSFKWVTMSPLHSLSAMRCKAVWHHLHPHVWTLSKHTLLMIVIGMAGTGKSYLINAIQQLFSDHIATTVVKVTTPTGIATANINNSRYGLRWIFWKLVVMYLSLLSIGRMLGQCAFSEGKQLFWTGWCFWLPSTCCLPMF